MTEYLEQRLRNNVDGKNKRFKTDAKPDSQDLIKRNQLLDA